MFFSLHISDHSADRRLWFLTCFLGGCHGIERICAVRDWSSVAVDSNKSWCVFTTDAVFSNQIGTASSVYPVLDLARTKSSHTCLICKGLGRSIYMLQEHRYWSMLSLCFSQMYYSYHIVWLKITTLSLCNIQMQERNKT